MVYLNQATPCVYKFLQIQNHIEKHENFTTKIKEYYKHYLLPGTHSISVFCKHVKHSLIVFDKLKVYQGNV